MPYNDIFHQLEFGAPLFSGVQITAAGKLGNVLDRRDLVDPDGDLIGFVLHTDAVATADAANYITIVLHHADEKTDGQTLTDGAKVNVGTGSQGEGSGSDSDVLGYTVDGVRQVKANPAYDATLTATAQTEQKNLQDGVFPKLNDTALAGKIFFFCYRGYKDVLQLFAEETGSADVTVTAFPVFSSRRTRNLVNPTPAA